MSSARTATALLLAALLAGCSGSGEAPQVALSTSAAPGAQPSSAPAVPAAPAAGPELGPVTGTKTVSGRASTARVDPVSVRLDFHGLHRDGKLLRLDYSVTSLATTDERFFVPDLLDTNSVSEIVLLDTTRLKKYLVVEDSEGQRLFTPPNVYLVDGQRFEGTAYFAAPPAEVTELELVFTRYGRFPTPVL